MTLLFSIFFLLLIAFNGYLLTRLIIERFFPKLNEDKEITKNEEKEENKEKELVIKGIKQGKVVPLFDSELIEEDTDSNNSNNSGTVSIADYFIKQKQKGKRIPRPSKYKKGEFPVLSHIMLWGPPGLGKTTLSHIIYNELLNVYPADINFICTTPLDLKTKKDLDRIIFNLKYGDVVFIDEIHGLNRTVEESLYSILQDFKYGVKVENGYKMRNVPACTFIGATTLAGELNRPLRERFVLEVELEPPDTKTLMRIINDQETIGTPKSLEDYHGQERAKQLLELHIRSLGGEVDEIATDASRSLAERSCGTPRIAKQLYKNARARAVVVGHRIIQLDDVEYALALLGVDENGLQLADQRIVRFLMERFNDPIGADNLAKVARVSLADLKQMIEPRLINLGLLERTRKGRILTVKALKLYKKWKPLELIKN